MQNISDCSIREHRSIVATITGHQALSPGLNQGSECHPTIYVLIKMAYFNYVDISASFKNFHQKLCLLVFVIIKSAMLLRFTNPSKQSTFNVISA